jgi:hypothetical protein
MASGITQSKTPQILVDFFYALFFPMIPIENNAGHFGK